jgi:hypothetical protein
MMRQKDQRQDCHLPDFCAGSADVILGERLAAIELVSSSPEELQTFIRRDRAPGAGDQEARPQAS